MAKLNKWSILGFIILLGLILILPNNAFATSNNSTVLQEGISQRIITFEELGVQDTMIPSLANGDTKNIFFHLPHTWTVGAGATLTLELEFVVPELIAESTPGIVSVKFNNRQLGIITIDDSQSVQYFSYTIPIDFWLRARDDGSHRIELTAHTQQGCDVGIHVNVLSSSTLTVPYTINTNPVFNLSQFPRPFVQDSLNESGVVFVLPSEADPQELEAASAIAAQLGSLGQNAALIRTITDAQFNSVLDSADNLIVVGTPATSTLINELAGGNVTSLAPGTGSITIVRSPWNASKAVLIVAGPDPAGALLAAKALSTDTLYPMFTGVRQVVTSLPLVETASFQTLDGTFRSFGYIDDTRRGDSTEVFRYKFDLPGGYRTKSGSYIDIRFSHAAPLDPASSLTVAINDIPVGSIGLTNANQDNGRLLIRLPNDFQWWQGNNEVSVRAELLRPTAGQACGRDLPSNDWPWITIYDKSYIYVDPILDSRRRVLLDDFPYPFIESADLSGFYFSLGDSPTASALNVMLQMSAVLGQESDAISFSPHAAYAGSEILDEAKLVIAIGTPVENPQIALAGADPLEFLDMNTGAITASDASTSYGLISGENYGFASIITPSTGVNIATLLITGTNEVALSWAGNAYAVDELNAQIAGNLAVIQETLATSYGLGIYTPEEEVGRLEIADDVDDEPIDSGDSDAEVEPTTQPEVQPTTAPSAQTPETIEAQQTRPALLIVALLLTVGVLGIILYMFIRRLSGYMSAGK